MENTLINIEDLQIGDEVIISCQSHMKYLKLLDNPRKNGKSNYYTHTPLYKSIRCSTRQDIVTNNYLYNGKTITRTHKEWKVTPENHNIRISQDFNNRQIWLVRRENNN